jgi:hypothetical protein
MKAAIELAVKLAHAKFDHATQVAHAKEHGVKDSALDALSFEDTDAE